MIGLRGRTGRVMAPVSSLLSPLFAGVRRVFEFVWRVVAFVAAVLGGLLEVAWRGLLLVAGIAMPIGGVLMALGNKELSDTVVTAGFAIGILAVPSWLATRVLARIRPPRSRKDSLGAVKEEQDEDLGSGADEELGPNDRLMSGERS